MTCHRLQFMCNIKMRKIIKRCEIPQAAEPEGDALSQLPPDRDGGDGLLYRQMFTGHYSLTHRHICKMLQLMVLMPPSEISLTLISSAAESLQEEKLRQRSRRWPQKFPDLRSKEHPDLNSEKERRFGDSKQRDIPPATAAPPVFHDSNAAAVPTGSGGPTSVPRLQCGSPVTGAGPVPRPVPRKGPIKTFWPAGGGLREILQPGNYHNMDS